MSFIECVNNAKNEGVISQEKQIDLEKMYADEVQKAIDAGATETEAARLAGKATFESFQYKAINKKRHAIKQLIADNRAKKYMFETYRNLKNKIDPSEALKRIVGLMEVPEGTTRFLNLETRMQFTLGDLHKEIDQVLLSFRHTLIGETRNKATLKNLGEEIFSPGSSGNKAAEELATALLKAFELARKKFNAAGGSIPKANFNYLPQYHNSIKVGTVSQKEWIDFVLPMVDKDKMINYQNGKNFSNTELKVALGEAYNNIIFDGHAKKIGSGHNKSLVNTKLDHRFIHFKDFDSWNVYQNRFGDGDLYNIAMTHLQRMSRDIAILEVMGPNPDAFLRRMNQELTRWSNLQPAAKREKTIADARSSIEASKNMYYYLKGDLNIPINPMTAKNLSSLRQLATASYLGSASILALGDFNLTRTTAAFVGMPQFKTMMSNFKMFVSPLSGMDNNTRIKIAATSGLAADHWSTLASAMSRYSAENVESHEIARRMSDVVLRGSTLSWLTQAGRYGAFIEFQAFSARSINLSFKKLKKNDPKFADYLESYGIGEQEWNIIRQTKPFDAGVEDHKWKGAEYLRADDIASRTDISPTLAQELSYKYGHAAQEFVNFSVPVANARGATLISGGTQPGTVAGELARSILQFKNFPLTFNYTHMARGIYRKTIKGKVGYILPLLLTTTVMGLFAHEMKNITKGKNISTDDNWNNPAYWINGMLHGGGLGFVGDILFGGRYSMDSTAGRGAELLGPTAGFAFKILDLTFGNLYQGLEPNKKMNLGSDISNFLKHNTPGGSIWYLRLVLERYLFEYIQEMIDPQYRAKTRRKILKTKKNENNDYWWQPGEKSPSRAPGIN